MQCHATFWITQKEGSIWDLTFCFEVLLIVDLPHKGKSDNFTADGKFDCTGRHS